MKHLSKFFTLIAFVLFCCLCSPLSTHAETENPSWWSGRMSPNGRARIEAYAYETKVEYYTKFYDNANQCTLRLEAYKEGSSIPFVYEERLKDYNGSFTFEGLEPDTVYDKIQISVIGPDNEVCSATTDPILTPKRYKVLSLQEAKAALSNASKNMESVEFAVEEQYGETLEGYAMDLRYCPNAILYFLSNQEINSGDRSNLRFADYTTVDGKVYSAYRMDCNVRSTERTRELNDTAKRIVKELEPYMNGASDLEKIYILADYICRTVDYEMDTFDKGGSAYACLVGKKAYCVGYSYGFAYLCAMEHIPCYIAGSDGHAWNYVLYKGKLYAVDTTWNDINPNKIHCELNFFMKGSKSDYFYGFKSHNLFENYRKYMESVYPFAEEDIKITDEFLDYTRSYLNPSYKRPSQSTSTTQAPQTTKPSSTTSKPKVTTQTKTTTKKTTTTKTKKKKTKKKNKKNKKNKKKSTKKNTKKKTTKKTSKKATKKTKSKKKKK